MKLSIQEMQIRLISPEPVNFCLICGEDEHHEFEWNNQGIIIGCHQIQKLRPSQEKE